MADTNSTTTTLNNLLSTYYVRKAIATLYNNTPLIQFADKTPMPKGEGVTVKWNAWRKLAGASVAPSEGVANSLPSLSSRVVTATIAQYGRGYALTDLASLTTALDSIAGAQETLTYSAKETIEYVLHMGIYKAHIGKNRVATTNLSSYISSVASAFCAINGTHNGDIQFQFPAVFGASVTRLSAVSKTAPTTSAMLSVHSIRKGINKLERLNAMPRADGTWIGYAHSNAIHTLRKDITWREWNQYSNSKETLYANEEGKIHGVRFIKSNLAFRYAVAAHSVNAVFIFGQGAYGITELDGGLKQYLVSGADKSDPFNQLTKLTYKYSGVAAALNPSCGVIRPAGSRRRGVIQAGDLLGAGF